MPRRRLRAAILGATGSVGQKLITLLDGHPWIEVTTVAASARSAGRRYREAVRWLEPTPIPAGVAELEVIEAMPETVHDLRCDLAFSALGADVARRVEPALARAGVPVVSNASAFRMAPDVPLLVPEINPDHLALIDRQRYHPEGRGFIVTNPNCSVTGLVCALKPLDVAFGVETVRVTTLQAASGAGYPGVSALDLLGNVVPHIRGEEEKIETEPLKILGGLDDGNGGTLLEAISAQVHRVPVVDGHLLAVSLRFTRPPARVEDVARALEGYANPLAGLDLPSAPEHLLAILPGDDAPQPRLHRHLGGGMTVAVGRIRPCPLDDVRMSVLVHNTVRGAAGGAILNAELLVSKGRIGARPAGREAVAALREP